MYRCQPLLPPGPGFSELIIEALLDFKICLISLPWKLAHQGLSVLLTSSLEHPFAAFVSLLQTFNFYRETVKT